MALTETPLPGGVIHDLPADFADALKADDAALATWRDILDVATASGRLDAKAQASVISFLEDPEAWSLAHGGKAVAS